MNLMTLAADGTLKAGAVASTDLSDAASIIYTTTNFVGAVTGTPGATVVGDDSHAHTATTITLASTDLTDTVNIIYTTTNLVGDVTGTPGATVVGNDSHNHTSSTITLALTDLSDTTIAGPASGHLLLWDGSDSWDNKAMSGDGAITNAGVFTLDDLVGDVTGPISATVVGDDSHAHTSTTLTLGSIKTLSDVWSSMTPTNDQVLYWDNGNSRWDAKTIGAGATTLASLTDTTIASPAEWQTIQWDGTDSWDNIYPAMVNQAETRTFTVLAAGSSVATINTALTNYKVVYLQPGSYPMPGTTALVIGTEKSLIGLGSPFLGTGINGAYFSITGNSTGGAYAAVSGGARVENIAFLASAGIVDANILSCTGNGIVIKDFYVNSATVSNYYAVSGQVDQIDGLYSYHMGGVDLTATSVNRGSTLIKDFYIVQTGLYGIRLTNVGNLTIQNGRITSGGGTSNAIYASATAARTNIRVRDVQGSAMTATVFRFAASAAGDFTDLVLDNCVAEGTASSTDRGFQLDYCDGVKLSNCHAHDCDGSAAAGYGGFIITNSDRVQIDNCSSTDCDNTSNAGLYVDSTVLNLQVNGFVSNSDYYGVYSNGASTDQQFNSVNIYDSANIGFYTASANRLSLTDIKVYSAGSYGILVNTCTALNACNLESYDSTDVGVYLISCLYGTMTGINGYNAGNIGICLNNCDYSSASSLAAYSAGVTAGIYIQSCDGISVAGATGSANTGFGFYATGSKNATFSSICGYNNTNYGIRIDDCDYSSCSAMTSYSNGTTCGQMYLNSSGITVAGASSNLDTGYGYYIQGNTGGSFSAMAAYDSTSHGFYMSGGNGCTYVGLSAYSAGGYGINIINQSYNSYVGLNAYNCANSGIYVSAVDYSYMGGVQAYFNSGSGVVCLNTCNAFILGQCVSTSNTAYGIYLQNSPNPLSAIRGGYTIGNTTGGLYQIGGWHVDGWRPI